MKTFRTVFAFFTVLLLASCELEVNVHLESPKAAGNAAADFTEQFLITKDVDNAYALIHEEFKKKLPKSEFKKWVEATKSVPNIHRVKAISYEDTEGQKGNITIFMEASRIDNVNAYIAIYTHGNSNDGYRVIGLKTLDKTTQESSLPGTRFDDSNDEIIRSI